MNENIRIFLLPIDKLTLPNFHESVLEDIYDNVPWCSFLIALEGRTVFGH